MALMALAVGAGCSPGGASSGAVDRDAGNIDDPADRAFVPAVRQDVVESKTTEATVGFGTIIDLPIQADGVVTWAPAPRSILRHGDTLVEVAGRPVILVIGESPLYRPLRLVGSGERDVAGTRLGRQSGQDVTQLQQFLIDRGFTDSGRLEPDGVFGPSTQRAVKSWQTEAGHPSTGVIDAGQMVFLANEVMVETEIRVGQIFSHLEVTGTTTVLEVSGSTTLREFFVPGTTVEVMADPPTTGTVTRSSRLRLDSGDVAQSIEITVDGVDPDQLGQSVQVVGSVTRATDALTVPVRALLVVSDGRWLVETRAGSATQSVAVDLIGVVGTTAIVSGIDEGTEVVVPR